jgi:uncharacterized protein (DUF3084 family)
MSNDCQKEEVITNGSNWGPDMCDTDPHPDRIFVPGHHTDFEKLLFARSEIKDLKKQLACSNIELGKANSLIEELQATIKDLQPTSAITKAEKKEFRAREYNLALINESKELRKKIKKLQSEIGDLVARIVTMQNKAVTIPAQQILPECLHNRFCNWQTSDMHCTISSGCNFKI